VPLVSNLNTTMNQTQSTLSRLESKIDPLASDLEETLQQARTTMLKIEGRVDPLSDEFNQTLVKFQETVQRADDTIKQFQNLSATDSQLLEQVSATLREVNQTAREARFLVDELERDPQLLLRGRTAGGKK